MSQPTQIVPIENGRLILGFDGGCMSCSTLAERVKELAGERLEVLSLRDPQMVEWRRRALGEDAPWAPTLIEINGLTAKAWTGWRLGAKLSRSLNPVTTWRIMQALGEIEAVPVIEKSSVVDKLPSRAADVVVGMSRGQFIKGVGGATIALGVLSGFGSLVRPAAALEEWHLPTPERSVRLTGIQLRDYCNRIAQRSSVEWTAGTTYAPDMQSGLFVTSADDGVAQGNGVRARAWEHYMANGNSYYACTFDLKGRKLLTFYEYEKRRNAIKYEVKRWGLGPAEQKLWAERAVINGTRFTDPNAPSLQASCPESCASFTSGQRQATTCSGVDLTCLFAISGCVGIVAACLAPETIATKIACAAGIFGACGGAGLACCGNTCTICVNCYVSNT